MAVQEIGRRHHLPSGRLKFENAHGSLAGGDEQFVLFGREDFTRCRRARSLARLDASEDQPHRLARRHEHDAGQAFDQMAGTGRQLRAGALHEERARQQQRFPLPQQRELIQFRPNRGQRIRPDDDEVAVELLPQSQWRRPSTKLEPQMDELTIPFLGERRAGWQYPFRSLEAAGAALCAGSDWPSGAGSVIVASANGCW